MDWEFFYSRSTKILRPVLNPIFITGIVSLASLILTYLFLKKEKEPFEIVKIKFNPVHYSYGIIIAGIFVGYFTGMLEITHQAGNRIINYYSAQSYSVLYHFLSSFAIIYFASKNKNKKVNDFILILSCINIILYIIIFHQLTANEIIENLNSNLSNKSAFFIHYILLACLVYFGYSIIRFKSQSNLSRFWNHKYAPWIFVFCIVYIISNEAIIHGLVFSRDIVSQSELTKKFPVVKGNHYNYEKVDFIKDRLWHVKSQIIKIGYPILWGVLSFVFLIIGIKKQNKQLRIIALVLLGITIIKLFFYDIRNVSETGKIIAFILLGVLILVISFVYQKVKRLVIDESKKTNDEESI